MTENQAIEFLKGKYPSWGCDEDEYENAQIAIQALEEIQQYRAIGTVEECKQRKEYFDIINEVLKDYSDIGTIEECRVAVERMQPRKLVKERKGDISFYNCPICNHILGNSIMRYESPYCPNCGTAIDWSK